MVFSGEAETFTPLQDVVQHYPEIRAKWVGATGRKPNLGKGTTCRTGSKTGEFHCKGPQWIPPTSTDCGPSGCAPSWGQTEFRVDRGLTWCDNRRDKRDREGRLFSITEKVFKDSHWATDMPSCGLGGGGTNHHAAIDQAWDELLIRGNPYARSSMYWSPTVRRTARGLH